MVHTEPRTAEQKVQSEGIRPENVKVNLALKSRVESRPNPGRKKPLAAPDPEKVSF